MERILVLIFVVVELCNGQQSTCFSQQEFEKAYDDASKDYRDLKDKLFKSVHSGDCGIPKNSPIHGHFRSSHISPEILAHDEFATVCNIALKALRKNKTLSSAEFKSCLSKIVTSKYCTPLVTTCTFSSTRLVMHHKMNFIYF